MPRMNVENTHSRKALDLANSGIAFGARGDHAQALLSWEAASDYADEHLNGEDIYYWIKSGLGAALHDVGDFQRGIAISEIALAWCSSIKQPLPAITIARCHLRLGNTREAKAYLDRACHMAGLAVLDELDPADRLLINAD